MKSINISKINTIAFGGGGVKVISYIGFYKALLEHIDQSQIKHYIGTSAGCVFAYFIIIGYTIEEIIKIMYFYDFNSLVPTASIDELIYNLGLTDGIPFKNFLTELLNIKLHKTDITFQELYDITHIKLTFCLTNFTTQSLEYWNHETTPNNSVISGLLATCRVPLFFTPFHHESNVYLDGGIINNYPINYVLHSNIDCVVGVCLTTKLDVDEIKKIIINSNPSLEIILNYIISLFLLTFQSKIHLLDEMYLARTIQLNSCIINFLDANVTNETKDLMISSAYKETSTFFQNNKLVDAPIDKTVDN